MGDGCEAEVNLQIVYTMHTPMLSRMSEGVVDVNRVHKGWNECGKVGTPRVDGWCERVHQHRNGMER